MNTEPKVTPWKKTKLQGLVQHKNGGYYARFYLNGKEVWKSLKTKTFSIAEMRFVEAQKEHRQRKHNATATGSTKMTFGQAAEIHLGRIDASVKKKRRTKEYWHEIYTGIKKHLPEIVDTELRKLTKPTFLEWAGRFGKTASSTRFNNSVDFMRHIMAVGVELGVVFANSAEGLERKTVKAKRLELPTLAKFAELIAEMSIPKGRYSKPSAELAEGIAVTGTRISEARRVEWRHLDFPNDEITIIGDPEEGTKNGEIRRIPMIPQARALFERMRAERPDETPTTPVYRVGKCQESMDKAMEKLGIVRMTHHDLRHFFATVCIESGVDIPTVSRWLGHRDGGVLAFKVYGHLRREHSMSQAQKVSFAPQSGEGDLQGLLRGVPPEQLLALARQLLQGSASARANDKQAPLTTAVA
jgi:integrase